MVSYKIFFHSCRNDASLSACKTLTKVNVAIEQGLAAANRILPIDTNNEINSNVDKEKINISEEYNF